jgi:hypothetical protein
LREITNALGLAVGYRFTDGFPRYRKNLSIFSSTNGGVTENRNDSIEQQLQATLAAQTNFQNGMVNPSDVENDRRWSGSSANNDARDNFSGPHAPHPLCKFLEGKDLKSSELTLQMRVRLVDWDRRSICVSKASLLPTLLLILLN